MKKPNNWLKHKINKYANDETFILEGKILELAEQISIRLEELKWSKKDLAEKMSVSPAFVTKLLNGKNNYTLKTLFKVAESLNLDLDIKFESKEKPGNNILEYITTDVIKNTIFDCDKNKQVRLNVDSDVVSLGSSDELISLNLKKLKDKNLDTCGDYN